MRRPFLLSPARASGARMGMLHHPRSQFELAGRFHRGEASLGELFAFASGLYFRGKLAYASAFGEALVILPGRGLVEARERVTPEELRAVAAVPVDPADRRFREPLERDARALAGAEVVLLGSIATGKYADVLLEILGARLLFPADFVGRGDMSRGGLLLRCVRSGEELEYAPLLGAVRHGKRPAKLTAPR